MRKVLHIDMDAFYASVEQRDDPSLKGKPVIVGWAGERSVVCAASYEARKFGVHSAMPASRAKRLCPEAVWRHPDFERYRAVSQQIRAIFERHTPLVEPLSLDEAYLDVTHELTGIPTATEAAEMIRREIRDETHLTASAGVAPNKFLAKIASDWRKPDGIFVIRPHQVERFLVTLPVRKIPGVGKATEAVLREMGIVTVGDLQRFEQPELVQHFGKWGTRLWELARGIDESPVEPSRKRKSWSSENTFGTDVTRAEAAEWIREQCEKLWNALEQRGLRGRTVTVKLRTPRFETATRQLTPPSPPSSAEEIADIAVALLGKFAFAEDARFRLVGVGVGNFDEEEEEGGGGGEAEEATLFEAPMNEGRRTQNAE
ncbi:MAG: DNA polymerase IV [Acidobacteria bacterium]|nr:DNA polymerase IV [Acidobacteriota bacterium]MBV9478784.1 DNA polymerase IV [Acidobacteriota bacterium]